MRDADTSPLLDAVAASPRYWRLAVCLSVACHAVLLGVLVTRQNGRAPPGEPTPSAPIAVTLARSRPRPPPEPPTQTQNASPQKTATAPTTAEVEAAREPPKTEPALTDQATSEGAVALSIAPALPPTALDAIDLEGAIKSVTGVMQPAWQDTWLRRCRERRIDSNQPAEDCRERKSSNRSAQQGAIDAATDALFTTWISGNSRNARISKDLLTTMDRLRPLAAQRGVLGDIARSQYALASLQYDYLNKDEADKRKAGGVQIVALSPGGFSLFGGLLSINFDGSVNWLNGGQEALPFSTGPVAHNGEEATAAPPTEEFVVQAPLFK